MHYEVISRFLDRERGVYVDPGTPCPRLSRRTATRLVKSRCIAPIEDAPVKPPSKKPADKPADPPEPTEPPTPPPAPE